MSGHNRWSQIKNQKGTADKKRGQLFSKLVRAISIAAKPGSETSVAFPGSRNSVASQSDHSAQRNGLAEFSLPGSQSVPQSGTSRSSTSWKTEPKQSALNERQYSPRLRAAIQKAEENSVPKDNIERAINKAGEEKNLEDIIIEAYGPEGSAIIIEGITDSKNRAISEIKHILTEQGGKIANPGSVLWSFNPPAGKESWEAKFPQAVSEPAKEKINRLIEALEEHEDVQKVTTNVGL